MAWPTTSRQSRGYGAEHDRIRKELLETVVICEECKRRGKVVPGHVADHIKPLAKGGTSERSNYQLLCRDCAKAKDATDRGIEARPTIGVDGWPTA